jgi:hypothetical protein
LILLKARLAGCGTLAAMGQKLKETLARGEMLQLLNWELSAYEQCDGCHFSGIERLGAGWSAHLDLDPEDAAGSDELALAREVLEQTRRLYDLR